MCVNCMCMFVYAAMSVSFGQHMSLSDRMGVCKGGIMFSQWPETKVEQPAEICCICFLTSKLH